MLAAFLLFAASTGLIDHIREGRIDAARQALESGADANAADERGLPALSYAAVYSTLDCMKMLVERGAKVDQRSNSGGTPLMAAMGDPAKVRWLVEKGADVNAKNVAGNTALFLAAWLPGGESTALYLLDKGAKPNTAALNIAATRGHERLVKRLLAEGVDPKQAGNIVTAAAGSGSEAALRMVLDKGATLTTPTGARRSALMTAAYYGSPASVRMLLDRDKDIDFADNRGRTALMYAAGRDVPDARVVRMLLDAGADPAKKDERGDTAADWAALRADPDVMRALGAKAPRAAAGPSAEKPALKEALARANRALESGGPGFFKANGCISCHNQSIPQMAAAALRAQGIEVDAKVARTQASSVLSIWRDDQDRLFQTYSRIGGLEATMTYGLVGLGMERQPRTPLIDGVVHVLSKLQKEDGSWTHRDIRPPLGMSDPKFTALAVRGLRMYQFPGAKAEFDERVARAARYLASIEPRDSQSAAFQVLGLRWAEAASAAIDKAARRLASMRRDGGGWSQQPEMAPDAYATAQAVWALREGAGWSASRAEVAGGIEYLRSTQRSDGSWFVRARSFGFQPYRETGFPHGHDQWISSAATGFAVLALAGAP